ncbi:hypothetical protein SAMN05216518_14411 [Bacteroidales bacterium KHT7]|nr:hypothetical protein SAMN05216518_14411 [Bacteroidales bacterium KHT7]
MQEAGSAYAVIDGFHIPLDKVKTYNAADADTLILATDGYPQLFPTLAATEAHLQECLHEDPLMHWLRHSIRSKDKWIGWKI